MMFGNNVFQLIDLDRTLFNTSLFLEKIFEQVDHIKPTIRHEIASRIDAAHEHEETFFAQEYIRQSIGIGRYDDIMKTIVKQSTPDIWLMPGAKERLQFADNISRRTSFSHERRYGILSYSLYPDDQYLKVKIAGLAHVPLYIIDTPDKATLLQSWQLPEGGFLLPNIYGGYIVNTLTLEDDKLRAFYHLPQSIEGVWITTKSDAFQQLERTCIKHVSIARDLYESTKYLKQLL